MKSNRLKKVILFFNLLFKKQIWCLLLGLLSLTAFGQNETKRLSTYNLEKKVALQGYDPVAYFKQNKALKGKKDIATFYQGVVYHFYSTANKQVFLDDASRYEPQYGGWCAYAMGDDGEKVEVNPETFKFIDGRLYLFIMLILITH